MVYEIKADLYRRRSSQYEIMPDMIKITGDAAENLLRQQLAGHVGRIKQVLAPFDPVRGFEAWFETYRAIEELINLPIFGIDDVGDEDAIGGLRLDFTLPMQLATVRTAIEGRYGAEFFARFARLLGQASAMGLAFREEGFFEAAAGFETVGHFVGYLMSRRRHLVALLYAIPQACRGTVPFDRDESLVDLLPLVEANGLTVVGLQSKLALAAIYPDFALDVSMHGIFANHRFETLEEYYLEPERVGILDTLEDIDRVDLNDKLEPVDARLLFSAAELRNNILTMESAFAEFDLASSAFGPLAAFVRLALDHCLDDWRVELSAGELDALARVCGLDPTARSGLIAKGTDYLSSLDCTAPFIDTGRGLVSSVTLLGRFLYYSKSSVLGRGRRFQIRSGYIFEDKIKAALTDQGFKVTDVKRINRKEFDIVAVLGDVIFNVQCKNNLVDLERLGSDPQLFARYNRRLERYYVRSLDKEEGRADLLRKELDLQRVEHFVVSRFPVATTNKRIFCFNQIAQFRERVVEPQEPE